MSRLMGGWVSVWFFVASLCPCSLFAQQVESHEIEIKQIRVVASINVEAALATIDETVIISNPQLDDPVQVEFAAVPFAGVQLSELTIATQTQQSIVRLDKRSNDMWRSGPLDLGPFKRDEVTVKIHYVTTWTGDEMSIPIVLPPWKVLSTASDFFSARVTFDEKYQLVDSFPARGRRFTTQEGKAGRAFDLPTIPSKLELNLTADRPAAWGKHHWADAVVALILVSLAGVAAWRFFKFNFKIDQVK